MRIAVTGTTGRVGAALVRHLSLRHQVISLPRNDFDLFDHQTLADSLGRLECDIFVNPAGLTSLESCEDDPVRAMRINAEAPAQIAKWAEIRDIPVIHFSTDYVFGGQTEGLREEIEPTAPINTYGRSKLAGEISVLANPSNTVIRVSWVFGPERVSFVDQVFDSALAGIRIAAVSDKFSLPVFTGDLAVWVECLIDQKVAGVIHACNSGDPVSWHDMATAVVEEMVANGILSEVPSIQKQTLREMISFRAERPRFTAMSTQRLAKTLGHPPRPWRKALAEYITRRCLLV